MPRSLLDIARTTASLRRWPRADVEHKWSSSVASVFAAASWLETALGLSKDSRYG